MIAEKKAKKEAEKTKKQHNAFMKLWRIERDTKYKEGITT